MKKYLITEIQRDAFLECIPDDELCEEVAELKPIEPLSRGDIDKIYERIDDYYSSSWTHKFARDIEAYIIGEKK